MNFTREPIIETIISPKDGYKLCVRNSKVAGSEEFFVDAVEVVSFGNSFFLRGLERPKPFLVPVSDYEVFEVKETRVVLKNIAHDRNIKIGGGREASLRPVKEVAIEKKEEDIEEVKTEVEAPAAVEALVEPKNDRKRDRRRSRRRRLAEEKKDQLDKDKPQDPEDPVSLEEKTEGSSVEEVKVPSMMFTHLLPPPSILISERLNKMKEKEIAEAAALAGMQKMEEIAESLPEESVPFETPSEVVVEHNEDHFPI